MNNPSGPTPHHVSATPYYGRQHPARPARPRRYRGRHRAARPYLAVLPEPETLVLPAITEHTAPPAPTAPESRAVGPRLERQERTGPAEDMGELAALCQQLIAQRPDLAHPVHDVAGVRR